MSVPLGRAFELSRSPCVETGRLRAGSGSPAQPSTWRLPPLGGVAATVGVAPALAAPKATGDAIPVEVPVPARSSAKGDSGDGALVFTASRPLPETVWRISDRWAEEAGMELGRVCLLGRRSGERTARRPPASAMERLRNRTSSLGVDANWVPSADREKRILVSDMDSTIIPVECFDEVAAKAGVGEAVRDLTARAMGGTLSFPEAYRARLALCAGVPLSVLEWVWRERVSLNPGAATLVRTMAARGAATILVTGGFRFFAERVAALAGFAAFQANGIGIADGHMTGEAEGRILDGQAKRAELARACDARGVPTGLAAAIGDGANDAAMVELAGLGVAWRAKPRLRIVADTILDCSDLDAVLALQGIPESEYVAGRA